MSSDLDLLAELNARIATAENEGNREFFENALAPVLAFRRANGLCVDRSTFLQNVKPGTGRRVTNVESIDLVGSERAVITCIVSMEVEGEMKQFHNFRLFVRSADGEWRLLAWANEPT